MVLLRRDALAEHHLDPGVLAEQLDGQLEHPPGLAEQFDAVAQRVWYVHRPALAPEVGVRAVRHMVVQDDEIAHVFHLEAHLAVELVDVRLADAGVGEHLQQAHHAALDQVDAGGLQRLDEAGGKPHRHAVLVPMAVPLAGDEAQHPRFGEQLALDVAEQAAPGFVVAPVGAGEHHAVADAVLQRDAPLPARFPGDGSGVGNRRPHGFRLHGDGAIAGQPVPPVFVVHAQRLADQQAAKARAVDEEVAFDQLARLQANAGDEAALGILPHLLYHALAPRRPMFLGDAAQKLGVQRRIHVVGVVQPLVGQHGEAALLGRRPFVAVLAELLADPHALALQPEVLEASGPAVLAGPAERVDVVLA